MKERDEHKPTSSPESQTDQSTFHTTSSGTVVVRSKAERDFDRAHKQAFIQDALSILRSTYDGPLLAYPDSGYFKMPKWQFDAVIPTDEFRAYADQWAASGVQVIGGCCGLSPDHIRAIAPIKHSSVSGR